MRETSTPVSLLLHDGELRDICELMEELGLRFRERRGSATHEDRIRSWDLVVGTPRHLLELDWSRVGQAPRRIAVVERDSRTLRSVLQRAGIDLVVRRPVHPASLRLLLLHTLYDGPEKRQTQRVTIGSRVIVRTGWRRRPALLVDLSLSGCRLLCGESPDENRKLKIALPRETTGGKPLTLKGSVLRCTDSEFPGVTAIAVSFAPQSRQESQRLSEVIVSHASGPAQLAERDNPVPVDSPAACSATPLPPPEPERRQPPEKMQLPAKSIPLPPPHDEPDLSAGESHAASTLGTDDEDLHDSSERRSRVRHVYDRHVIALGIEATRVLIGRDISMGGMRVDPNPNMSVGDQIQLAIHVREHEHPLVIEATVARDDGHDGMVLQFQKLSTGAEHCLQQMIDFLPILAIRDDSGEGTGIFVSEILHHRPAAHSQSAPR